jgi:hypothetical protein
MGSGCSKSFEAVRTFGATWAFSNGSVRGGPTSYGGVAACVAAPWPSAWEVSSVIRGLRAETLKYNLCSSGHE